MGGVFLFGLLLLCFTSFTDALGDSEHANPESPFWRWFYNVENTLFTVALVAVGIGALGKVVYRVMVLLY